MHGHQRGTKSTNNGAFSPIDCSAVDSLASKIAHCAAIIDLHIVDMGGQAIDTTTAVGRLFLTIVAAMAEMERGLISERTQESMEQLKAMNRRFTHSIYGWDVTEQGDLIPNWNEQHIIDYMAWQIEANGMSATAVARQLNRERIKGKRGGKWTAGSVIKVKGNPFHEQRKRFPNPKIWGNKPWHRWV